MLAAAIAFIMAAPTASGYVNAELDRQRMQLGESVRLEVSVSDAEGADTHALRKELLADEIQMLQRAFEVTLIEEWEEKQAGTTQAVSVFLYDLKPRHEGVFYIPPFNVLDDYSWPLKLRVGSYWIQGMRTEILKRDPSYRKILASTTENDVKVEVAVEPESPYVGSYMILTARAYIDIDLSQVAGEFSIPDAPGSSFELIETSFSENVELGGKRYRHLIENRFGGVPARDGAMIIPEMHLLSQDSLIQDLDLEIRSEKIEIDVQPVPASYPADAAWLPARQVTIEDSLASRLPSFVQGQPAERQITIRAEGVSADQLPSLHGHDSGSASAYGNPEELDTEITGGAVRATRSAKFVYVPNQSGRLVLPEIEIVWWDINENKVKRASAPGVDVTVAPVAPDRFSGLADGDAGALSRIFSANLWTAISLALAAAWMASWLYASFVQARWREFIDSRSRRAAMRREEALRLYIKQACAENRAHDVAQALIRLARDAWPRDHPRNLVDIGRIVSPSDFADELFRLDRHLFSAQPEPWQGKALWNLLDRHWPKPAVAKDCRPGRLARPRHELGEAQA